MRTKAYMKERANECTQLYKLVREDYIKTNILDTLLSDPQFSTKVYDVVKSCYRLSNNNEGTEHLQPTKNLMVHIQQTTDEVLDKALKDLKTTEQIHNVNNAQLLPALDTQRNILWVDLGAHLVDAKLLISTLQSKKQLQSKKGYTSYVGVLAEFPSVPVLVATVEPIDYTQFIAATPLALFNSKDGKGLICIHVADRLLFDGNVDSLNLELTQLNIKTVARIYEDLLKVGAVRIKGLKEAKEFCKKVGACE
jgi:hypothetical protein